MPCPRQAGRCPIGVVPPTAPMLIAVTLFLAVLIAEAVFLALNAPSVADLGTLAAGAANVP